MPAAGPCVIERETSRSEPLELRPNLGGQLRAHAGPQEEAEACPHQIGVKTAALVDQIGYALGLQNRTAVDEYDVQSDRELR